AYFTHTAPSLYIFCFLIILCPPRSTLFPYTTLFRSLTYGTLLGGLLSERWLGRPEPGRGDLNTASLGKYKQMIDAWGGWSLFQELLAALKGVADRHGASIANIGARYVLDRPAVAGIIVGARL